jgi:Uncharacterised nucleotidyltransferase
MSGHSTSVDLLVAALKTGAEGRAWLAQLAASDVDQGDLAVTALALGLAPLVQYRLEGWGVKLPDAKAQAKLDFARQAEAARQVARRAQLTEVLARLPAQPVVLKGAYLAECVYPAPGLRPMNDIDLLFRPEDLPLVAGALHELGYGSKDKSPALGPGITKHTSTFQRQSGAAATPNPYLSATGSRMIEPHRSLEESWFGLKCDLTPGMWARSQAIEIGGCAARALAPADALLHLCVHLAFHLIMGSPSFVQLADLAIFTERVPVDWQDFQGRARSLHATGYAYAAARLASQSLAAGFPPEVLAELGASSPSGVRAAAERLTVADVMRRTQKPPLRTIGQRLRRGVADRAETASWAHSRGQWFKVWWTLIDVRRTDTFQMLRQWPPAA